METRAQTSGGVGVGVGVTGGGVDPPLLPLCTLWLRTGNCWSTNWGMNGTRTPGWIGKLERVTSASIVPSNSRLISQGGLRFLGPQTAGKRTCPDGIC